ncbi:hypothetical protein DLM_0025 [Aquitalea magnusonii]|uniref:Uncharacterized protein n=1 Tax=Aquitalea magnusonii TaxID=332411 RepID=A0A3G9GA24_9NEIS|nr:hypothetical protein DLM_0025 [Aquitalea magnusonii]
MGIVGAMQHLHRYILLQKNVATACGDCPAASPHHRGELPPPAARHEKAAACKQVGGW